MQFISPVKKYRSIKNSTVIFIVFLSIVGYFQLHNLFSGLSSMITIEPDGTAVVAAAQEKYQFIACPNKAITDKSVSFVPTRISIASINANLPVVSVPLANGTWEVFSNVANYAEKTGLVTLQGGNVGIYGHDKKEVFAKIKDLNIGDSIEVSNSGHTAIYRVKSHEVVKPNKVSIFYPTNEPTLTLATCEGIFSETRYAVTAELVSIQDTNCS